MTIQPAVEVLLNLIYVVVNRLELFIFDSSVNILQHFLIKILSPVDSSQVIHEIFL